MKVAMTFPGCHRRGGVERIILECANFMEERGHETHVFATDWDEEALRPGVIRHQVDIIPKPAPDLARTVSFIRACRRALRWERPRPNVLGSFGVVSPPGGVLWVQSVHAAWLEISQRERDFKGRAKQKVNPFHSLIIALEKQHFGQRRYRKLIALSPEVKNDLMRFYAVPERDIVIIPNGFAPREFNLSRRAAERADMRQKLGYQDSDKVVIFVANELERKGFAPLLRAIAALKDERIHLLAVGRLSAEAYRGEISQLGMSHRVQFTGPSNEVASYYAAADVFALPTHYEAWGLVIVEAMACGLPVLTSRLAGASITVREGQNGQLLEQPHNVEEVTNKLSSLLDGQHLDSDQIADSVAPYAWNQVLLRYEETLASCAT